MRGKDEKLVYGTSCADRSSGKQICESEGKRHANCQERQTGCEKYLFSKPLEGMLCIENKRPLKGANILHFISFFCFSFHFRLIRTCRDYPIYHFIFLFLFIEEFLNFSHFPFLKF